MNPTQTPTSAPAAPTTASVDKNYFMQPGESVDAYKVRVQNYNTAKDNNVAPTTLAQDQAAAAKNQGAAPPNPAVTPAGGTYTGQDGKQYYNANNQPVAPTATAPSSSSTGAEGPIGGTDANGKALLPDQVDRAALQQSQADYQRTAQQVRDTITNIQNGVIPLNAGENAQIAGLQQQFQTLIDAQTKNNRQDVGMAQMRGAQKGALEYDPHFQMGTIQTIVSAGAAKIADLQIKEASAVASMTQAFKDNDIKAVQDAWSVYKDASKERQDALSKTIADTATAIKDAAEAQQKVQDSINAIAKQAQENGATATTIQAITRATSTADAITAAGDALQTGTGEVGEYLFYKRQSQTAGHVPMDFADWKASKDAADTKAAAAKAYATAYASESAKSQFTSSTGNQNKLEQQYRSVLLKELGNKTGGLGLQDAKVNQAIHLKTLYTKFYDPKTGNYNIPTSQYAELALGLASLLSPTGNTSEGERAEIKSKTLNGDLRGMLQYVTGVPQNGNSQQMMKNLIDSIERQGAVSEQLRDQDVQFLHGLAPTDLDPERVQALEKNTLPSFVNPTGDPVLAKQAEDKKVVDSFITEHPNSAATIKQLYSAQGATDSDVAEYIGMHPELVD